MKTSACLQDKKDEMKNDGVPVNRPNGSESLYTKVRFPLILKNVQMFHTKYSQVARTKLQIRAQKVNLAPTTNRSTVARLSLHKTGVYMTTPRHQPATIPGTQHLGEAPSRFAPVCQVRAETGLNRTAAETAESPI